MRCQVLFIGNGYDVQLYRFIGTLLIKVEFVLTVSLLGKFVDDIKLFFEKTIKQNLELACVENEFENFKHNIMYKLLKQLYKVLGKKMRDEQLAVTITFLI